MEHLTGHLDEIGWVVAKAALLYLTAVIGFRVGERRTLAQLSPFDVVAAVAVGAIVGRIPNAHDASYVSGAATLVAVLGTHAALTRLRLLPSVAALIQREPRLLIAHGQLLTGELRRCGLTRADLEVVLRQQGIEAFAAVRYAVLEQRGQISVVRETGADATVPELLQGIVPARPT